MRWLLALAAVATTVGLAVPGGALAAGGTVGTISTIAGNGTAGYSGDGGSATSGELAYPGGMAVDPAGDVLIGDTDNNRVRLVAAASCSGSGCPYGLSSMTKGDIYTVAGNGTFGSAGDGGPATSAELNTPSGVAVDAGGDLLIADSQNNVVRLVAAASCSTGCPYGLAQMTKGDIYTVTGSGNPGYSGDGGAATSAQLFYPGGVAVDAGGDLLIADSDNERVRLVAAASCSSGCPYGLAQMTRGDIYTVAGDGTYGYAGDGAAGTSAQLAFPSGVAVDAGGDLLIADTNNNVVRLVAAASCSTGCPYGLSSMTKGDIYTVAGNGTQGYSGDGAAATGAELSLPLGVAVDAVGDLLIADTGDSRVRLVAGASCSGSGCPYGLSSMTEGDIYTVAGNGTGGYSGDGGPATGAALNSPSGVAVDPAGDLLIADTFNNRVRLVSGLVPTTLTLTAANPAPYGSGTALTATLGGAGSANAGGTVTFYDGGQTIFSIGMAGGTATLTGAPCGMAIGDHTITASYSGDGTFAPSSAPLTASASGAGNPLVITPDPTSTTLTSSLNPSSSGQAVTLTATTLDTGNCYPDGSVTFYDGATKLATETFSASSHVAQYFGNAASFTTSALSAGSHMITAKYTPTVDFASSSGSLTQVVNAPPSVVNGPPSVVTGASSAVTTTGAQITGTVNPNGATAGYQFEYGTSTAYGSTTPAGTLAAGTAAEPVSAQLAGLAPNTTYHYRLDATDGGATVYGRDMTFTTMPLAPGAATGQATAVGQTSATISGTVTTNGVATSYYFTITDTQTGKVLESGSGSIPAATPSRTVTLALTGLTPGTTYAFKLTAVSDGGTTSGATQSFTTGKAAPAPPKLRFTLRRPSLAGDYTLKVPCRLTGAELQNCQISLFDRSTQIGQSAAVGSANTLTVTISLNGTGRRLLDHALAGLPITIRAQGEPATGRTQHATEHARLYEKRQTLIPARGMFGPNNARLTAYGRTFLLTVARSARNVKKIQCEGFTASVYGPNNTPFTIALARHRAQVARAFLKHHGIRAAYALKAIGKTDPLVPNTNNTNRARNRRIELIITHHTTIASR